MQRCAHRSFGSIWVPHVSNMCYVPPHMKNTSLCIIRPPSYSGWVGWAKVLLCRAHLERGPAWNPIRFATLTYGSCAPDCRKNESPASMSAAKNIEKTSIFQPLPNGSKTPLRQKNINKTSISQKPCINPCGKKTLIFRVLSWFLSVADLPIVVIWYAMLLCSVGFHSILL